MSNLTPNLNLFKYDVSTDTNVPFSITKALNNNWDIIDAKYKGGGGLEVCDIGMALYVDETKGLRRYLNGQIVDRNTNTEAFFTRLKEITTLHPSLLDTEENWQAAKTLSPFGQVGKFVFNYSGDEVVSVRIPRVVNVQGLFDLQNLGMTVYAGLPTHTHTRGTMEIIGAFQVGGDAGTRPRADSSWANGAFSITGTSGNANTFENTGGGQTVINSYDFHASRSWTGSTSAPDNSVYGASNTVQQEAIQYPYFIQIATGSETEANIVNALENVNGFTLLESKYSDKPLYNESWLLSNGQYNAKVAYPTVYEGLQVEYNTEIEAGTTVTLPDGLSYTKRGLSVKLSTEEYTDYDFVLNTAEETFRLPLLDGSEDIPNYNSSITGSLPFTVIKNGWIKVNLSAYDANTDLKINDIAISGGGGNMACNDQRLVPVSKGDVVDTNNALTKGFTFFESIGNGSLYYYVGDIDQNHGIVNMGRIGEQLATIGGQFANFTNLYANSRIVDSYQKNQAGYVVWANGFCLQWGTCGVVNSSPQTYTFLKTFKYAPVAINQVTGVGSNGVFDARVTATNSQISITVTNNTGTQYTSGIGAWYIAIGFVEV